MTLKEDMADDVSDVFLDEDDFAEAATYQPRGAATSFACVLVASDVAEQFVQVSSGTADQRRATATGDAALLAAGIAVIEGVSRPPARGDLVEFAVGTAFAGLWFVETVVLDIGGAATLGLRYETRYEVAGDGASGDHG